MSTFNFYGGSTPDVTISWTGYGLVSSPTSNGVRLPTTGQLAANGNRPIYVTAAYCYWAGRGGTRSLRLGIGGNYSSWRSVGSSSSAGGSGSLAINAVFQNGGNATVAIDENGTSGFYFGRASGTGLSTDGYTTNFGGSLSGYVTYYQVPSAPSSLTSVQNALTESANLSWTAPASNGGLTVTNYAIDYSTSPTFATHSTINTGSSATTYTVTELVYGQTYYFRVAAINSAATAAGTTSVESNTASTYILLPNLDLDGWANYGTLPANNTATLNRTSVPQLPSQLGLVRKVTATATGGAYTSGTIGIRRTFTGLTVGKTYQVAGSAILNTAGILGNVYRFQMNGSNGSSVTLTSATVGATVPSLSFVATATTHIISFTLAEAFTVSGTTPVTVEDVSLYNFTVTRITEDITVTKGYWLQDTKYTGTLADYFDLSTRSIGGAWWVDKTNVTKFTQEFNVSSTLAFFSDGFGHTPTNHEGDLHYSTIDTSFDSKQIVNGVTLINSGQKPYDATTDQVLYEVAYANANATSQTTWGSRSVDLTTNLWLSSIDNYLPNPSVEISTDGLISLGATAKRLDLVAIGLAASPEVGGSMAIMQKVPTAVANPVVYFNYADVGQEIFVTAGSTYTTVGYGMRDSASSDSRVQMRIRWHDEGGVFISEALGAYIPLTSARVWYKATHTAVAPANATTAVVRVVYDRSGGGNMAVGYKFYTDGVGFFWNSNTTYFDGGLPDTASYIYDWLGSPHASISRRSVNRMETRIQDILASYSTPTVAINGFTWNAAESPLIGSRLDIGSIIDVSFRGTSNKYRVVGLDHTISPNEWVIGVKVQKVG